MNNLRLNFQRTLGGFSLLELIMVMGMLSVIIGFVLVSFPASQKRARDTQRKSDIKQYQAALEVYANRNDGLYPRRNAASGQRADTVLCGDLGLSSGECSSDPKDGTNQCNGVQCRYLYQSNNPGCGVGQPCATRYVVWGALEQPDDAGNAQYFVTCSNGISGEITSGIPPSSGNCPI